MRTVAAAAVVALTALPATAGPGNVRQTESATYSGPAGVWAEQSGNGATVLRPDCMAAQGCVSFAVPAGATTVDVQIQDETGLDTVALVHGVTDEGSIVTCAGSTGPVSLTPPEAEEEDADETADEEAEGGAEGGYVHVVLASGICEDGTPGFATAGTVTATFGGVTG